MHSHIKFSGNKHLVKNYQLKDVYKYWALNRILKSTLLTALLSNSKHHDLALGNIKDQCHGYCVKLNTVITVLQFHYEH